MAGFKQISKLKKGFAGTIKLKNGYKGGIKIWSGGVEAGEVVFTTSQIWTIPDGVEEIDVFLVGAGGAGYYGEYLSYIQGGGGGAGGRTATHLNVKTTPKESISIVIGAGGKVGTTKGGDSSFGSLSVSGGNCATSRKGADGGSGGSAGVQVSLQTVWGRDAGSDGSDSKDTLATFKGLGQGTTTKAFGESGNTLFSGGASGGGAMRKTETSGGSTTHVSYMGYPGSPGAGGGGMGARYNSGYENAVLGTPNTGGGGGGGYAEEYKPYSDSGYLNRTLPPAIGGSGIVIVRWKEQ